MVWLLMNETFVVSVLKYAIYMYSILIYKVLDIVDVSVY